MKGADLQADDLASELEGHLEFVRRMARALVRDEHVAEDVVQETMMAAIAHRPSPSMGLRVWLTSVLRRQVFLHFRTEQRRVARETLHIREERQAAADATGGALRAMESIERTSMIGRSVADLPDPYRTVLVMRFFDGLAPLEISRRLDRPINTVSTQLQRGLERLRQALDERNGGNRRAWIVALLPHAMHGREGWWPATVGGVGGVSYGVLAQLGLLLLGLVAGAAYATLSRTAPDRRTERTQEVALGVQADRERQSSLGASAGEAHVPLDERHELLPEAPASTDLEADPPIPALDREELRVVVRSNDGFVQGATVAAKVRTKGRLNLTPASSEVTGIPGIALNVQSTMEVLEAPTDGAAEPRRESIQTGHDGVGRLPILDGQRWTVLINADGYASQRFILDPSSMEANGVEGEYTVLLEPEARLVIDRGSFPLESLIVIRLQSLTNGYLEYEKLLPGMQELEFNQLQAANWEIEALSDSGEQVGHWYRPAKLEQGLVMNVDLSQHGAVHTMVRVSGGSETIAPHFVQVTGSPAPGALHEWSHVAPIFDGTASFSGLPPGPATVRVLSRHIEVARTEVELQTDVASSELEIRVPDGVIEVLHPGINPSEIEWRRGLRLDSAGAKRGWATFDGVLPGAEKSLFAGCAPGEHRLWMFHGDTVRSFDVDLLEASGNVTVELDAAPVSAIKVERGEGLNPKGAVDIEVFPGVWRRAGSGHDSLQLSHGAHRIRHGLDGLGFVIREVDLPQDTSVHFEEPDARRRFSVVYLDAKQKTWLEVVHLDPDRVGPPTQQLVLIVDDEGKGSLYLRPGRYEISDAAGRSAMIDVGEDPDVIEFVLR